MKRRKTALVTGATGAIGGTLIQHLVDKEYQVRVLVRKPGRFRCHIKDIEVIQGDINELDVLVEATKFTDIVFHLAAKLHVNNPSLELFSEYNRVNVEGTRCIVEAAKVNAVSRLIFFSTISVYGPSRRGCVLDENSPLRPASIYAETKQQAEQIVLSAKQKNNKPFGVVLRLAAVYGPNMKGNYSLLVRALRGGWFFPIGSGLNRRTLVHERDVARAALVAAEHPEAPGRIYNVTDGQIHFFTDLLKAICQALGKRTPRHHLPVAPCRFLASFVEKGFGWAREKPPVRCATVDKLVEDVAVSGHKIQDELGFCPRYDIATGWREVIRHILEQRDATAGV